MKCKKEIEKFKSLLRDFQQIEGSLKQHNVNPRLLVPGVAQLALDFEVNLRDLENKLNQT